MTKNPSATEMLKQVTNVQSAVTKQTAKEYAPWIGWGLYVIVFFSPFDYVEPAIWGPISWVCALAGSIITFRYFSTRAKKVQKTKVTPSYAWFLYGLWIFLGVTIASALQSHFDYPMTVAGFIVGLPFIAYGLKLKKDS